MIARPDLLDANSPEGIEVFQLTDDPGLPSCHVYMEAQIFTPDSKRFILHRSATPHRSDPHDPRHQYQLCDIEDGCSLHPLTYEVGATGPSLSPDGNTLYYFVDETEVNGGRLLLKRVNLDGTNRETILVLDTPIPGTTYRPSSFYPLSSISSDGQRLAISAFLGDGQTEDAPWGLLIFDLTRATVELVLSGQTWCNIHPQYCRALDAPHELMVQENHGNKCDPAGRFHSLGSGEGADIHLIRDDGTDFRNLAWGRDGNEHCQGHQCWVGRSRTAITSTVTVDPKEFQLIAGLEAPYAGHIGINTPGGQRNDLSRAFDGTSFFGHFATDIEGTRFVTDCMLDGYWQLYFAHLPHHLLSDPISPFTYLLNPLSEVSKGSNSHAHPFLSPDGSMAFFNSDESGTLQAYMIRGLDSL